MKINTMTIEEEQAYKAALYNEADVLWAEAKENYELGFRDVAEDCENRFRLILNQMILLGWDLEYMGIA